MASHLVAYQQSIDAPTLTAINTVVDDVLTRTGSTRYLVPAEYNFVRWAAALGPNLTRAILVAPSFEVRRIRADIVPHRRGASTFSLGGFEIFQPPVPLELTPTEEMEAQVTEDAAGASQVYVLVNLGPAEQPAVPAGDIRPIRLTGSTTLTANAWTTVTMTPELSLEPGTYSLVAFLPISANCIAARALFVGQTWRPGVPGFAGTEAAARDFDWSNMQVAQFYEMGSFTHLTIPQFQFLSSAADTSETVLAWVVKTG
jgi:hypothetical protein